MAKKSKRSADDLTFSRSAVRSVDIVYVLSEKDVDTEHTKFLIYNSGAWSHHVLAWGSAAVVARASPKEAIVVGADGEWMIGTPSGFEEGEIDPTENGPAAVGAIRDARAIGSSIIAVGMGRTAYQRVGSGRAWRRIDDGLRAKRGVLSALHGVDGWNTENIVAVGGGGEVWRYNGNQWTQLDSPTNLDLHRVRCVGKNLFYACGAGGVLIRGVDNSLEVVDHGVSTDNLYGMEWFRDALFIASLKSLYRLEGSTLTYVDPGIGVHATFGDLSTDGTLLWSTGAKHLAMTRDGEVWQQVFCT